MLIKEKLENLYQILKKEVETGFKNNTVFGGISLFVKKLINTFPFLEKLQNYNDLNYHQRQSLIYSILPEIENFLNNEKNEKKDSLSKQQFYENGDIKIESELIKNVQYYKSNEILNTSLTLLSSELNLNKRILNIFKKNEIKTLKDLIWFFPRSYSDRTKPLPLNQAINYEKAYVIVEIISDPVKINAQRKKLTLIKYFVRDNYNYKGELIFFNQEFIVHHIKKGQKIKVFGRILKNKIFQIIPEEWEPENAKTLNFDRIVPHYSISINPQKIRLIMYNALKIAYKHIDDPLIVFLQKIPSNFAFKELSKSIINVHFPSSFEELSISRNRVALEEIIYTQILLNGYSNKKETVYKIDKEKSLQLIKEVELPFELTEAQKRVINQIIEDLASGKACRRLIQGDVGAGKTIVAFLSCYIISKHSYQSCIMAPTEILANQHFSNFQQLFPNINVKVLTSKVKGKQRKQILEDLKEGKIEVLIGTHALIEENVEFKNLALIIVDEQHKFGVNQRFKLYSKSDCPHLIVMSATPIPRTLALTVYSDLDISVIDQLPPGRKKAITEIFNYKDIEKVYNFVENQLKEGRQAYIVCPSIFENPKIDLKNVEKIYTEIENRFKNYNVAYLHGKMSSKQKEEIMNNFRNNFYSILVSTTVVEVGIDVPNANTIVVLDAERFGLSQLHQLRGRVKRSFYQPYCLLVTSKNLSALEFSKSVQRLSILKYYDDGFKIAEKDLELRGPGEILGYKQHGFTEFKILNPIKDYELIKFSNFLAKKISHLIDKSEFLKKKLKETKLEVVSDTI